MGEKQVALIGGQTNCPSWWSNRLSLFGDKQDILIGGQTGCPYLETNRMSLLGDKQVAQNTYIVLYMYAKASTFAWISLEYQYPVFKKWVKIPCYDLKWVELMYKYNHVSAQILGTDVFVQC